VALWRAEIKTKTIGAENVMYASLVKKEVISDQSYVNSVFDFGKELVFEGNRYKNKESPKSFQRFPEFLTNPAKTR